MESSSEVKRSTHVINVQANETVLTALPYRPHSSLLEFLKGEPKVLGVSPLPLMGLPGKKTISYFSKYLCRAAFSEKTLIPPVSPHLSSKMHPSFYTLLKEISCVFVHLFVAIWLPWVLVLAGGSLLWRTDFLVMARGLGSCGLWASLLLSMWDLHSLIRDWTCVPCIARQILSY